MSERLKIQRKPAPPKPYPDATSSVPSALAPAVRSGTQSGGAPLDRGTQSEMSARFGHDFSSVRVHTDARAEDSAQAFGANAYAVGSDIVFGPGKYNPGSRETERLLAHELTHVVQQERYGLGDPTRVSSGGDASEQEAERVALGGDAQVRARPGAALARSPYDPFNPETCPVQDQEPMFRGLNPDVLNAIGSSQAQMDPAPGAAAAHHESGQKPGEVSGPYAFRSDDPDNSHFEAGLYHGHGTLAGGENTTDLGYMNSDIGDWKDNGATHYGARANAGVYNATGGVGPVSVNVQAATAGAEASVSRHGFNLNAGLTSGGVTGTAKGDDGSVSLGVSGGPQFGVGLQCNDHEDSLYDGASECCFSEQFGPLNGQFCADGSILSGPNFAELAQKAKTKEYDKQYAAKVKGWHDEQAEKDATAQRGNYVYASPEQRQTLPHSMSDMIAANLSDATFAQTPPAERVSRGDDTVTPEDIFGYGTTDPVCRADDPVCRAPLPSGKPAAVDPGPQASPLAPADPPQFIGPQPLPQFIGPQPPPAGSPLTAGPQDLSLVYKSLLDVGH